MNGDMLDRYDKIQRLGRTVTGSTSIKSKSNFTLIVHLAIGIAIGVTATVAVKSCDVEPLPNVSVRSVNCPTCHTISRHAAMTSYFSKAGSASPEQMATAVLMTRSPRLLAAIHVAGEKKSKPSSRNTGYKGRYSGAWQTAKVWGKVTDNIVDQALIAELALNTHVKNEKDIVRGLNAYGGHKDKVNGAYAYNVIEELQRVP